MSKSKVIITGGSGFLGKAVNKTLKDNLFYDVVSLGGKREYDLTNQKQVDYLYKEHEPDVIVHLAARVGGIGANKDNPGLFMYENLVMGMNLIETARKYGKLQKFVMVGTVCAYPKFTPVPFKEDDIWNVATYLWNETQTDAILELNGFDTQVNWVSAEGVSRSTLYHVPNENECITCHQSKSSMIPLGTKLRNLNRVVNRNGTTLNQINHLQSVGVLNDFEINQIPKIVDYNDLNASLAERGRAYLEMNCAHCHNPDAWDESADEDFDFRYEISLSETGILFEKDRIIDALLDEEMPFIGTTILDQEGVSLVVEFIESL